MFDPYIKRRMLPVDWRREFSDYDDYWYLRQFWRPELEPWNRMQYLDLKTYLPDDILTKVDRASMAVSLELRPPLLDHVLVESILAIPASLRVHGGQAKYLLKGAADDLLPHEIVKRKKKGFGAPWYSWMEIEQSWINKQLTDSSLVKLVDYVVKTQQGRISWGNRIWALLVLNEWSKKSAMNPVLHN
jgi:asparagine synthase (glutamine-hydrolysing)